MRRPRPSAPCRSPSLVLPAFTLVDEALALRLQPLLELLDELLGSTGIRGLRHLVRTLYHAVSGVDVDLGADRAPGSPGLALVGRRGLGPTLALDAADLRADECLLLVGHLVPRPRDRRRRRGLQRLSDHRALRDP